MIEAIGLFLVEILFGAVAIAIWDFIFESLGNAFMPAGMFRPTLAAVGLLLLGLVTGLLSVFLLDHRITPDIGFRGISLVLAPAAIGALFELLGRRARGKGANHTALFTWWGGSISAFGIALGRLVTASILGI